MNGVFKLFTRRAKNKPESSLQSEDKSPIQLNWGTGSSLFSSDSKRPLIFAVILNIALTVLGYRYFHTKTEPEASLPPIAIMAKAAPVKGAPSADLGEQIAKARNLFARSQLDDSLVLYQGLLKNNPNDTQILNDLGVLYLKKKKLAESEDHLNQSLALDPQCVICLNNLGYLKTLQGESAEAERYLKKAISINQEYIDPYFNLGVLYEKNGDIARSANAYGEFLSRSKDQSSDFNLKLKQHIFSILEK